VHVLFLTFHLPAPDEPGAARPWAELELMQELGWQVTVVTASAHYLTGSIRHRVRGPWKRTRKDGTTIIRTWSPRDYRRSSWRRLACYLGYSVIAAVAGLTARRVDAVFVGTDPPFVTPAASLLALLHRAALVVDERDVYPDTALAVGLKPSRLLVALLSGWNGLLRRQTKSVITVSPGLKELLLSRGADPQCTFVIPNYFPSSEASADHVRSNATRPGDAVTVIYAGSLGRATHVSTCIDAAELLVRSGSKNVRFVFLGAGERRQAYANDCQARGLDNVTFPGAIPRDQMERAFADADIALHSFSSHPYWRRALSSKIFEYMSYGLPVVFSGEGDIADLLRESDAGLSSPPEDAERLAQTTRRLVDDADLRSAMGQRGRRYVSEMFSRARARATLARAFGLEDSEFVAGAARLPTGRGTTSGHQPTEYY